MSKMKKAIGFVGVVLLSIMFIALLIIGMIFAVRNMALAWVLTLALAVDFIVVLPLWYKAVSVIDKE